MYLLWPGLFSRGRFVEESSLHHILDSTIRSFARPARRKPRKSTPPRTCGDLSGGLPLLAYKLDRQSAMARRRSPYSNTDRTFAALTTPLPASYVSFVRGQREAGQTARRPPVPTEAVEHPATKG